MIKTESRELRTALFEVKMSKKQKEQMEKKLPDAAENKEKEPLFRFRRLPTFDYIMYAVIVAVCVLLDQLTKLLAVIYLKDSDPVTVIPGVVQLKYSENKGAAFGMFADSRWAFMIVSVIMIAGLVFALAMGIAHKRRIGASVAVILAGGIGNMIDRVALGYVVDFIEPTFIDFAIFNGADSFICVGAALLAVFVIADEVVEEIRKRREAAAADQDSEQAGGEG